MRGFACRDLPLRLLPSLLVIASACGDNAKDEDYLGYEWDDRRVLCSHDIDNINRVQIPNCMITPPSSPRRGCASARA
jgi:hypothetical protein